MRVSTSKPEAMVLCRKIVCSLRVGSELLPQAKEFKYLGVLFTSEGKMEQEMDRRIDLQVHLRSNPRLWSRALGSDRKNEIAGIQAAEMSFLRKVAEEEIG